MSRVTMGQVCELFRQIAEELITREILQEFLESKTRASLFQFFKKVLRQARKAIAETGITGELEKVSFAEVWAEVGNFKTARSIAAEIGIPHLRARAFAAIALFGHDADDLERARNAARKIKASDLLSFGQALGAIAQVSCDTRDLNRIREIAAKAHYDWEKFGQLRQVAEITRNSEDLAALREIAAEFKQSFERANAFAVIANISKDPQDLDLVRENAAKIKTRNAEVRVEVLAGIALLSSEGSKDLELAREAQDQIQETVGDRKKGKAKAAIVNALAVFEDFELARRITTGIRDPCWRAIALSFLGEVTRDVNDFELAQQAAEKIKGPGNQISIFIIIAKALAKAMK